MARQDVSNTKCTTFTELIWELRSEGFNVDHFHAVEFVEISPEDLIRRMGDDSSVQQIHFRVKGGRVVLLEDWVTHLNFEYDESGELLDACWSEGDGHDAFDDDPRGWERLVADEWHDR